MFRPRSIFVQLLARRSQSCLVCAKSLLKDQQSNEDNGSSASTDFELVPEVENSNDINPGSSGAFVNMYDYDSYFNELSSVAESEV